MSRSPVDPPVASEKLHLLINKNVQLHLTHPLRSLILVLWPVSIFIATQFSQIINRVEPVQFNAEEFPDIDIYQFNTSSIFYSPRNAVLNAVIEDMARTLQTSRVESYLYAADLEDALIQKDGFVGIEFEDDLISIVEIPREMKIALRFPLHFRTNSIHKKQWNEDLYLMQSENRTSDAYILESYIEVEWALYEAIFRRINNAIFPRIILKAFPEPAYIDYTYLDSLYSNFITCFPFLFLVPGIIVNQIIITEKIKLWSPMRLVGLSSTLNWLSWLIVEYIVFIIPLPVIVGLMKLTICPSSDFFLLLFIGLNYVFAAVCFMFMIISFTSNPLTSFFLLISMNLISGMPYIVLDRKTMIESIIMCLFLNSAMPYLLVEILEKENRQIGMQWNNFFKNSNTPSKLNVGSILLLMALTNIVEILLGLYMETLRKNADKRWYFPCERQFWCPWDRPGRGNVGERASYTDSMLNTSDQYDPHPHFLALLEARNLGKKYRDKEVIHDFSLKFYEDEIIVFLGQNGSGKSMLLQLLAGLIPPTTGQVFVNGKDLTETPPTAADSIGFSHRSDTLYTDLSAFWHLVFYSRLRGHTRDEAEAEANRYLKLMNMEEFAEMRVEYLSPGMRQKLSVCCALCADTKVVICDQPTAFLDPYARREVCNLLRSEKSGRCILMSTHFIDSSEFVSDRIAILCKGRLQYYGTAESIVYNDGPGYRIVCICLPDCDVGKVTKFLINLLPDIVLDKIVDTEVTYRLSDDNIGKFTDLFMILENQLENLMVDSFRVCAPTLSETVMNLSREQIPQHMRRDPRETLTKEWINTFFDKQESSSWNVQKNYWYALILKKILHIRQHAILYCLIIALPLLIAFSLFILERLYENHKPMNFDPCDMSPYPGAIAVKERGHRVYRSEAISKSSASIFSDYDRQLKKYGVEVHDLGVGQELSIYILKTLNILKEGLEETYVAGASFSYSSVVVWYNRRLNHGPAISLGLLYNTIASNKYGMTISIRNKPRADTIISHDWESEDKYFILRLLIYIGYAVSPFVLLPIHESISSMMHIQRMSEINTWSYWLSHLFFDYCIFLAIIFIAVLSFLDRSFEFIIWLVVILLCFGFSELVFVYLISMPFQHTIIALCWVIAVNWSIGLIALLLLYEDNDFLVYLHHILLVAPIYALYSLLVDLFIINKDFNDCRSVDHESYCELYKKCCKGDMKTLLKGLIYLVLSGIIYLLLLIFLTKKRPFVSKRENPNCSPHEGDKMIIDQREKIDKLVSDQECLNDTTLVVSRASKVYKNYVTVNCVSLTIEPFEILGLLGLNGAGKTSIVEMIVGKSALSAGDIYVNGLNVKNREKQYFRYIGYCPQDSTLMPFMTGRQLLRFTCMISGIRKDVTPLIIAKLASSLLFSKDLDLRIQHYSQGTMRKLSIAMAVLAGTLIILDDHIAGLDINSKQNVWLILNYMRQLGRSLLITSQNIQECETFCTSLAIMVNGSLRCYGTVPELRQRYCKGILIGIQLWRMEDISYVSSVKDPTEGGSNHSASGFNTTAKAVTSLNSISKSNANDKATQIRGYLHRTNFRYAFKPSLSSINSYNKSGEGSQLIIRPMGINLVRDTFKADFPHSFILDRYDDRGYVTIAIPNMDFKWSRIFGYVESKRDLLQIKHYSISETTLEDAFLYIARDEGRFQIN